MRAPIFLLLVGWDFFTCCVLNLLLIAIVQTLCSSHLTVGYVTAIGYRITTVYYQTILHASPSQKIMKAVSEDVIPGAYFREYT